MNWSEYENEEPAPINHRPWWLEALLGFAAFLVAAIIIASFAGCTTPSVPACEPWAFTPVEKDGEPGIFLDQDDLRKLAQIIKGLSAGTCRIAPAGTSV